jgi:hypothetical protein
MSLVSGVWCVARFVFGTMTAWWLAAIVAGSIVSLWLALPAIVGHERDD